MIALNQYRLLHNAPRTELVDYIARVLKLLEGEWLERFAIVAGSLYESQLKLTPEYYRLEKIKKEERRRNLEKALERPGFILLAWVYYETMIGPILQAYYLPETGLRRVFMIQGEIKDADALELSEGSRGLDSDKPNILSNIKRAVCSGEYGTTYGTPALHLLNQEHDGRPAYLGRLSEAVRV